MDSRLQMLLEILDFLCIFFSSFVNLVEIMVQHVFKLFPKQLLFDWSSLQEIEFPACEMNLQLVPHVNYQLDKHLKAIVLKFYPSDPYKTTEKL